MQLYRQKRQRHVADGLTGIAPIYKVSFDGVAELIGTGFWITEKGHLITAWHVIADNIGDDGMDRGPIYAVQTLADRKLVVRVLRKSCQHKLYDLALSETLGPGGYDSDPTWTFSMTTLEPKVGDSVGTYSFLAFDQKFDGEKHEGISTVWFEGTFAIPEIRLMYQLRFATRINHGQVLESVREHQAGLQSFRSMRRIEARRKKASALRLRFSQSLASLLQRLSHAMVRSTIQRLGRTTNSLT